MATIAENLQAVKARMKQARERAGALQEVTLLAVSKGHGAGAVKEAASIGLSSFGENYVQEALAKMEVVPGLEWHLIGALQTNKARVAAERFDWIQTVDREKLARRLAQHRPARLAPLNVLIQVNVSAEPSKSGVAPGEVRGLAGAIAPLPRLRLRGLMAIPAPGETRDLAAMKQLYEELREEFGFDTLSMGMSDDLEAAIAAGATMVRVGTAIFGERKREKSPA